MDITANEKYEVLAEELDVVFERAYEHSVAFEPHRHLVSGGTECAGIAMYRGLQPHEGPPKDALDIEHRTQICQIGSRLFELGGLDAMSHALRRATTGRTDAETSYMLNVADWCWDGIGTDTDTAWAA